MIDAIYPWFDPVLTSGEARGTSANNVLASTFPPFPQRAPNEIVRPWSRELPATQKESQQV